MNAEKDFANTAFETLDKASLIKVLENLEPTTVLSLCQTNKYFADVCGDRTVFVRLMQVHYPNFPINQDAKAQYMAITAGEGVRYAIDFESDIRDDDFDVIATPNPDGKDPHVLYFTILGTKIRKGEKLFLVTSQVGRVLHQRQVFLTREAVIEEIASNQEELEGFRIQSIDKIRRIINREPPLIAFANKRSANGTITRYRYTVTPFIVG